MIGLLKSIHFVYELNIDLLIIVCLYIININIIKISINTFIYLPFSTSLILLELTMEYCQCLNDFPCASSSILIKLINVLKVGSDILYRLRIAVKQINISNIFPYVLINLVIYFK